LNEWIPENELEPVRETVTGEPQDGCNLVPDSGIFTDL
jgi:hypothetical protein